MEKLKAVFKCRLCGNFVIADMQSGRENNPVTIKQFKDDGISHGHYVLCDCPGFMTLDTAETLTSILRRESPEAPPASELYGIADLIAIIKI